MAVSRSSTSTAVLPPQRSPDNYRTTPQQYARTIRTDFKRVLTTGFGGKFLPIAAIPLLREDAMLRSTFRLGFQMAETAQMLMNPVRVRASAFFVPKLAFERYQDMGALNRSYLGQQEKDGSVIPWFEQRAYWGAQPNPIQFYQTMGLHAPPGALVNSDYVRSYNCIWNYMAEQASPSITKRTEVANDLAPAFWSHSAMRHVKPTFDQALVHGEVPLTITSQRMNIHATHSYAPTELANGRSPGQVVDPTGGAGDYVFGDIWAELEDNGVVVSLANIDLARKTAAFARARQAYQGLGDDQIIDLLMSGVRIPDEGLKHPMLIGQSETIFGMSQRFATDSGALEKSVTTGATTLDVAVSVPQQNTSGIVMFIAEILPEQLYERQMDRYLCMEEVAQLPDRMRDELDLEPVEIVKNEHIDVAHNDPTGTFGYAPLNHHWIREAPNLGGRYHRYDPEAPWTEDRDRIWAVETVDPVLGDDFYLASNIHHKVFADANTDPFEISLNGVARIDGLTFFGPALRESYGDYDAVQAHADLSRLPDPGPTS